MRIKQRRERIAELSAAIARKLLLRDDAQEHAIIVRLDREIEDLRSEMRRLAE